MPDGVIKWFDPKTGQAEVVRAGRLFPARAHDIEAIARRAGARVHFDISREHGVDRAIEVRLRKGTHVSHHQHRFGTLVGARNIDTKGSSPYAQVHPGLHSAPTHPLEVARAWATCVSEGDLAGALSLYSPDAVLHLGEEHVSGRSDIEAWLESIIVLGSLRHARIQGADGLAIVSWEKRGTDAPGLVVQCGISHTQIVDQWVSEPEPRVVLDHGGGTRAFDLAISTRGEVGENAKSRAMQEILQIVEKLEEPVLFARVKLMQEQDPARPRPAIAQAAIDVDGDPVRAHVAGHTMPEAVDLLAARLRDRLEQRARYREHLHRWSVSPEPGEWRHGMLAEARPAYFDRPVEERQLVRHKTFAVDELTPDEAVYDMDQLDYDFYLFCDLASGTDSIVERLEDGSYRLTRLSPSVVGLGPTAEPLELSATPVPVLSLDEAIEKLNVGGEHHVFFADPETGRGNVVYRRYDGHYGLVTSD